MALPGLIGVLLVGLALRLFYLLRASPFVDEYSTLMAVEGVLAHGIPFLPTGFFYGHDILYSYAATGAALLWPDNLVAVRALSLLASVGTIALTYVAGQRLFSWLAGLLSAAFVALSPLGVLWGARARAYALEQLLTLVAFWLFYLGVERQRPGWRRWGLLALAAAVFVHPEAALLLPGLALAMLVLHGFRWWFRLDHLLEFGLAGVAVIGRYLLQHVVAGGDVGGFDAMRDARPALGFLTNWAGGLDTLVSFLFSGPMLPATILALIAILGIALRWVAGHRAYAAGFLAITLTGVMLQMALLIGGTWQSVRYLLFAYPLIFLLAGAGLEALAEWLPTHLPRKGVIAVLAGIMILALWPSLPAAVQAANTIEIAYDHAFDYVGERWRDGDRLATLAPAAAWVNLKQVDFFALGETYEEFVWQEDGQWYDKWVGAPLIHTAQELNAALDRTETAGATLWLVTDESRLQNRFDADFVQMVWDRMSLVYTSERAQVFRSQPARTYAVAVDIPRRETFADQVTLAGYAIGDPAQAGTPPQGALVVAPGQSLPLRFTWQALALLPDTYTVFIHLTDRADQGYAQVDGLPLGGLYPMHLWQPGIGYPDPWTLTLPADLPPGRYVLKVGLYQLASGDRLPVTEGPGRLPSGEALILDYLTVPGGESPDPPDIRLDADLGGAIHLLGFSPDLGPQAVHPGDELTLTLQWLAIEPTDEAYTLFVHVVGADGSTLTQYDGQPQGGFYPTAFWDPGERLEDRVTLKIPADAGSGTYQVVAGLYLLSTGDRLPTTGDDTGPGDVVLLTSLNVRP